MQFLSHLGEKPYKCPVEGCGKGFTCSKQLKVHSRTHTGEKPYHCDICFRDFGYNHVLKLHRVQHYGSKCYKCTICDETFKSKKEMEAHIKGHANEIPDDEENGTTDAAGTTVNGNESMKNENGNGTSMVHASPTSTIRTLSSPSPNSLAPSSISTLKESSMDAHSDTEMTYYSLCTKSEYEMGRGGGVNPALLEAVSIAASAHESEDLTTLRSRHSNNMQPAIPSTSHNSLFAAVREQDNLLDHSFIYEPLAVMRQQGFFNPAPKVEEFKYVSISPVLIPSLNHILIFHFSSLQQIIDSCGQRYCETC